MITGASPAPFTWKGASFGDGVRSVSSKTAAPVANASPPALQASLPRQRAQNPWRDAASAASRMRWRCEPPSFPRDGR